MTEFDEKLRLELHAHKAKNKKALFKIADETGIARNSLYAFSSGHSSLNGENTRNLMKYLGLKVELKGVEI